MKPAEHICSGGKTELLFFKHIKTGVNLPNKIGTSENLEAGGSRLKILPLNQVRPDSGYKKFIQRRERPLVTEIL